MKKYLPTDLYRANKLRRRSTDEEKILWSFLHNKMAFPIRFRRQQVIGPYIVDFYCHQAKLIIELDGIQHATDESLKYDQQRTTYLERKGCTVLRFWNSEILNKLPMVLNIIAEVLDNKLDE